jgi:hypothetical protein
MSCDYSAILFLLVAMLRQIKQTLATNCDAYSSEPVPVQLGDDELASGD